MIALADIVGHYELGLVLIAGIQDDALERLVQWVHGSDLASPANFLTPRTVLLTTGRQFKDFTTPEDFTKYVTDLLEVGVTALGFGVEIVYERIPTRLINACDEAGLPLFRVPYDTPFIQISQTAARLLAAKSYARDLWSLETQRAISRAAVRGRGLHAAIDALASRLKRWVALTTSSGSISYSTASAEADAAWVKNAARDLLRRGGHANTTRVQGDTRIHLQTISGTQDNHGVLIIESNQQLDHAERGVIEFVTALASFYLEQHRSLAKAHGVVRRTILTLLKTGALEQAGEIALSAGLGAIPTRIRVCFFGPRSDIDQTSFEHLLSLMTASRTGILGIHEQDLLLVIPPTKLARITEFCESEGLPLGVSQSVRAAEFELGLAQAKKAYALTDALQEPVVQFTQKLADGLFELLQKNQAARRRAEIMLRPLKEHDSKYSENLSETLLVWLKNHGQMSAAANELSLHRHTVASRIKLAETLLQKDLSDALTRAECLSALTLTSD